MTSVYWVIHMKHQLNNSNKTFVQPGVVTDTFNPALTKADLFSLVSTVSFWAAMAMSRPCLKKTKPKPSPKAFIQEQLIFFY